MEAASARMAARDRYGAFGEAPSSPLQRFICMHHRDDLHQIIAYASTNSTSMRSTEFRAEPSPKSGDLRLDQ
jgi:hypothetical protein